MYVPSQKSCLATNYHLFFMKATNRDLLVLIKKATISSKALELEIDCLNKILFSVENIHQFCIANEVIDVNRYKIISKPHLVRHAIQERRNKAFVFINCKN